MTTTDREVRFTAPMQISGYSRPEKHVPSMDAADRSDAIPAWIERDFEKFMRRKTDRARLRKRLGVEEEEAEPVTDHADGLRGLLRSRGHDV